MLEALAVQGMNVARLNMCHGKLDWHKMVVDRIRKLNRDKGYCSCMSLQAFLPH